MLNTIHQGPPHYHVQPSVRFSHPNGGLPQPQQLMQATNIALPYPLHGYPSSQPQLNFPPQQIVYPQPQTFYIQQAPQQLLHRPQQIFTQHLPQYIQPQYQPQYVQVQPQRLMMPSPRQSQLIRVLPQPQPMQKAHQAPVPVIVQQTIEELFSGKQGSEYCDVPLEEASIYCVICNQEYRTSQQEAHLNKHHERNSKMLASSQQHPLPSANCEKMARVLLRNQLEAKSPKVVVKPVVEPIEYNVQYTPNQFLLKHVVNYEQAAVNKNSIAIETEPTVKKGKANANLNINVNQPDQPMDILYPMRQANNNPINNIQPVIQTQAQPQPSFQKLIPIDPASLSSFNAPAVQSSPLQSSLKQPPAPAVDPSFSLPAPIKFALDPSPFHKSLISEPEINFDQFTRAVPAPPAQFPRSSSPPPSLVEPILKIQPKKSAVAYIPPQSSINPVVENKPLTSQSQPKESRLEPNAVRQAETVPPIPAHVLAPVSVPAPVPAPFPAPAALVPVPAEVVGSSVTTENRYTGPIVFAEHTLDSNIAVEPLAPPKRKTVITDW